MSRIKELTKVIREHDAKYDNGTPVISDFEYDQLKQELRTLEKTQGVVAVDSPTRVVRGKRGNLEHPTPMLSLKDIFSPTEAIEWAKEIVRRSHCNLFSCEPKIDGLAIRLHYVDGHLVHAATRGDGHFGEDVTIAAEQIDDIPKVLLGKPRGVIEVRGEVYMRKSILAQLNSTLKVPFANCRNAAAGSLRTLDPMVVKQRQLSFFAYSGDIKCTAFIRHTEILEALKSLGFKVPELSIRLDSPDSIAKQWDNFIHHRAGLDYDIDGFVIKADSLQTQSELGVVSNAPRWAIAVKLPAEEATSQVVAIEIQVGRTGALTPVAKITPVRVGGVTVSSVNLFNYSQIAELGLQLNDRVWVKRAGDVIPHITKVITELRPEDAFPIPVPTHCPVCQSPILSEPGVITLRCTNAGGRCLPQLANAILHMASRGALNIDGIGNTIANNIANSGLVKTPLQLFMLSFTEFSDAVKAGAANTQKLWDEFRKATMCQLANFVYALGIPLVGESTAGQLARHFGSIENIYSATFEQLVGISDIGPITAVSIVQYFENGGKASVLEWLEKAGGQIAEVAVSSGLQFAITGTFPNANRHEIRAKLEQMGHHTTDTVNAGIAALIAGDAAGAKLSKAEKYGVPIFRDLTEALNYAGTLRR